MALLVLQQCRRPSWQDMQWETEWLVPVASGSLSLSNLLGDSLLTTDAAGAYRLVYSYPIYTLRLSDEYISVPDTSLRQSISLDSLYLPDRTINFPITLGQLARNDPSGQGQLLILFHGTSAPIPAFNNLSADNTPIDATGFFQTAEIDSGYMDIRIRNGFPVDITDLAFVLKNSSDGSIVVSDNIPLIAKGATISKTYDLQGKEVEGSLLADITNLSTPGSGTSTVLIDTGAAMRLDITVRDLTLRSALAIFPAQNLVNLQNRTTYNMGGPSFTDMTIRSGQLKITAYNTIQDSLYLYYAIPTAVAPSGQPIAINTVVAPAPAGGSQYVEEIFDLAGYNIDLRSISGNRLNTFDNIFRVRIDSTGKLVFISLNDSVSVFYGLLDIVPQYVKGYMGQRTLTVGPSSQPVNFLSGITAGALSLEDVTAQLRIVNPFGVDAALHVDYINSVNNAGGSTVTLQGPGLGQPIPLARGWEYPKRAGETLIPLSAPQSNIKSWLENLPQAIEYALSVDINPNGNAWNYQDFAYYDDVLEANLELEMPLSVSATGLTLTDDWDMSWGSGSNGERVQQVALTLDVDNGYPLAGTVQAYFLSPSGAVIDSLFQQTASIQPGKQDPATCRVAVPAGQQLTASLDRNRWERVTNASTVRVIARFDTDKVPGCGSFVQLYSNYLLSLNLTAQFTYAVGNLD